MPRTDILAVLTAAIFALAACASPLGLSAPTDLSVAQTEPVSCGCILDDDD
jgi:hypothetical protein